MKEGLIYRERGKGTFVWKGPGWKRPSLRGSIENLIASGVGTQIKVLSYKEVPIPKDLSDKLKMVKSGRVHRLELVRMISEGPQGYSLIYFPPDLGRMISRDDITETTEIISLAENRLGIEVHGAHQTISVGLASGLLAKCLSIKPRTPLLIIFREYFTRKGLLMILSKSFYRPDHFEYEIELTRK
jgi:GntR family transcriptional regulator